MSAPTPPAPYGPAPFSGKFAGINDPVAFSIAVVVIYFTWYAINRASVKAGWAFIVIVFLSVLMVNRVAVAADLKAAGIIR